GHAPRSNAPEVMVAMPLKRFEYFLFVHTRSSGDSLDAVREDSAVVGLYCQAASDSFEADQRANQEDAVGGGFVEPILERQLSHLGCLANRVVFERIDGVVHAHRLEQ